MPRATTKPRPPSAILPAPAPPSFTDHEVATPVGRSFYLLSDGCLDQHGGPRGFGFGETALKNLLLEIAQYPLEEQTRIVQQRLNDYRGSLAQRDDITLIAFRLDGGATCNNDALRHASDAPHSPDALQNLDESGGTGKLSCCLCNTPYASTD